MSTCCAAKSIITSESQYAFPIKILVFTNKKIISYTHTFLLNKYYNCEALHIAVMLSNRGEPWSSSLRYRRIMYVQYWVNPFWPGEASLLWLCSALLAESYWVKNLTLIKKHIKRKERYFFSHPSLLVIQTEMTSNLLSFLGFRSDHSSWSRFMMTMHGTCADVKLLSE